MGSCGVVIGVNVSSSLAIADSSKGQQNLLTFVVFLLIVSWVMLWVFACVCCTWL